MAQVALFLDEMKSTDQDFEWYPTTDEIMDAVAEDFSTSILDDFSHASFPAILDVGAGDGRVLKGLVARFEQRCKGVEADYVSKLAIEKSMPLVQAMPAEVGIVGADFFQQNLASISAGIIFSNPPYSQFEVWVEKLINEANAFCAYLVIPQRWRASERIQAAIKRRQASFKVVGQFDFTNAERKARAKVELVRVDFVQWKDPEGGAFGNPNELIFLSARRRDGLLSDTDPFSVWFNETFGDSDAVQSRLGESESDSYHSHSEEKREEIRKKLELVEGGSLVDSLAALYQQEMQKLADTYHKVMSLDLDVLQALNADLSGLKSGLRSRIDGLKAAYWRELFSHLDKITERMTRGVRERMLGQLERHASLEFNAANAHAIVIWAIKNANLYFDEQVVEVFDGIVERADVYAYKSNEKLLLGDRWRYKKDDTPVKLDYRMVLSFYSAIVDRDHYSYYRAVNGLDYNAATFLDDLLVVARNFGFDPHHRAGSFLWQPGKANVFEATFRGEKVELMRVKAYKNGNIHAQFNQDFIRRLNVEAGRLKGWLRSAADAADEFGISEEEAVDIFGSTFQLTHRDGVAGLLGKHE